MIVVFPGQGSQKIGMGKDIYDNFSVAKNVFQEVDDAINFSLSKLIFEGTEEDLKATINAQPALMAVSIAFWKVLKAEFGFGDNVKYFAGHSLGEYTALCAGEVLSLRDTANILRLRGKVMSEACPTGGAMAAILGLDIAAVENIVNEVSTKEAQVQIANDNSPGQVVISGHEDAVEKAMKRAMELKARNAVKLQVSGPFHSKLMFPAVKAMEESLRQITFSKPKLPIVTNITAKAETGGFEDLLIQQLTGRVRWRESILFAEQQGVSNCIEIGSGKVLTGLAKRIAPNMKLMNINSLESLSQIREFC